MALSVLADFVLSGNNLNNQLSWNKERRIEVIGNKATKPRRETKQWGEMNRKEKTGVIIVLAIFAIIIIAIISAIAGGGSNNKNNDQSSSTQSISANASTPPKSTSAKPAQRKVLGTATTIGAGTFSGGKDVAAGYYDVTPGAGQSGNFMVDGTDSYNEILGDAGDAGGVPKLRALISNGDKIEISGLSSVTFTPVRTSFVTSHTATTLYAGTFVVGEDVGEGRYTVTPGAGQSGNFMVDGIDSYNEILGGDSAFGGVPSVKVNLTEGDVITISGLSQVIFSPSS